MATEPVHLLFVCSRNQWRSPTGEKVYANRPGVHARSAGTSAKARRRVTAADITWADIILAMEDKHRQRLLAAFPGLMKRKEMHVLGIEDDYRFMDDDLVRTIEAAVDPILDARRST